MNTSPIFVSGIQNWWYGGANASVSVSTVNTGTTAASYDGTTNAFLLLTAGTKGSFVQKLVCEAVGPTGPAVSVLRIHINNGSTNATATNNVLYMQYSLPAVTVTNTAATAHIEIPLMLQLEPNFKIYVSLGAGANLNGGWHITAVGGDY